jgi:hypothetical protein
VVWGLRVQVATGLGWFYVRRSWALRIPRGFFPLLRECIPVIESLIGVLRNPLHFLSLYTKRIMIPRTDCRVLLF